MAVEIDGRHGHKRWSRSCILNQTRSFENNAVTIKVHTTKPVAELVFYNMYVNAIFGGCDVAHWAREGGRGQRARAPPSHAARGAEGAVAQAGAARGVRAATEGTLRRDFSKGLFEGTFRRDFSKGLCEGTFRRDFSKGLSQGLLKVSTFTLGFSNLPVTDLYFLKPAIL